MSEEAPSSKNDEAQTDVQRATPRSESVANTTVADNATDQDGLGFGVYVEAIEGFLTHDNTRGPLTLSIEGTWGSGKSSFMLQLRQRLQIRPAKTVWFNPWRHDKDEALWAAFALSFVAQLRRDSRWGHIKAQARLLWARFDWQQGFWDVGQTTARLLAWLIVVAGGVIWGEDVFSSAKVNTLLMGIWEGWPAKMVGGGSMLVGGLSSLGLLQAARRVLQGVQAASEKVSDPLGADLRQYIKTEDYAGRVGFIERFHRDFQKIVKAYAGGDKIYVFIDDLDRCDVPKAAELMQALNLLVSEEGPDQGRSQSLIFIIGMDREKVAASKSYF